MNVVPVVIDPSLLDIERLRERGHALVFSVSTNKPPTASRAARHLLSCPLEDRWVVALRARNRGRRRSAFRRPRERRHAPASIPQPRFGACVQPRCSFARKQDVLQVSSSPPKLTDAMRGIARSAFGFDRGIRSRRPLRRHRASCYGAHRRRTD